MNSPAARSHHRIKQIIIAIIILIIGVLLWRYSFSSDTVTDSPLWDESSGIRTLSGYAFTNPLLECENNGSFAKQKYLPFEKEIIARIEKEIIEKNPDTHLSVYFRNLNNGPWFGIAEDEAFLPASLMKVTLMMNYLKWWDEDKSILSREVEIPKEWEVINQLIPPKNSLIPGNTYTISEMLYNLIVYSDNMAARWLLATLPYDRQMQLFRDLSIPLPEWSADYSITVKEYASFFRILYNASYLSQEASEAWLNLLSQSVFRDGIVAWVPSDIRIAHKFGEREFSDENGVTKNQFHDCGIIYHPTYPYLLCIMTRTETEDINTLSHIISESSKIIFEEINALYPYKK